MDGLMEGVVNGWMDVGVGGLSGWVLGGWMDVWMDFVLPGIMFKIELANIYRKKERMGGWMRVSVGR